MDWYYVRDGQQVGPVSEADIQSLVKSGEIRSDSLVWNEGLLDWKTYRELFPVESSIGAPQPPPSMEVIAGMRACVECGKTFPAEEMVQYGSAWVCAACKPLFFQRLEEGAPIRGELVYGRFLTRFTAKFLDWTIIWVVQMVISLTFLRMTGFYPGSGTPVLQILLQYGFAIAYVTFFLGKFGATPGKMATGLKVVTPDGRPITYMRAFSRFWGEMLSGIILLIGYIMAAFDDENRALHDIICGTRVVLKSSVTE